MKKKVPRRERGWWKSIGLHHRRRVVDEILVSGKAGLADGMSLAAMKRLEKLGLLKITPVETPRPKVKQPK